MQIGTKTREFDSGFSDPTRRRVRTMWRAALGASLLLACGHAPETRPVAHASAKRGVTSLRAVVRPARLFALPDAGIMSFSAEETDGTRRLIDAGMRLLVHDDGRIERGREVFAANDPITVVDLPPRFGKGYLFVRVRNNVTSIWRASSWTGALEPFANLGFEAAQVVPGLERLYLVPRARKALVALDARSGAPLDPSPLPASPLVHRMAFVDEWFGAVDVPFRGVLVTFDAGVSWHPLGVIRASDLSLVGNRIAVSSTAGVFTVDAFGRVEPQPSPDDAQPEDSDDDEESAGEEASAQSESLPVDASLGAWPLKLAALRGWPDSQNTALVANDGVLARVGLADGRVLARTLHAYRGVECQGLPVGSGVGFACRRVDGGTSLFVVEPPLSLRPVLRFAESRFIAAGGGGAVLIRGGCGMHGRVGAYCIRDPHGRLREVFVKGADVGTERVVALADGRAAVIVPPLRGSRGSLSIVEKDGTQQRVDLDYRRVPDDVRNLLMTGLWLDGMQERRPGSISGWVVDGEPFVGVRIDSKGRVTAGEVQPSIDSALLSGAFAFTVHDGGRALETVDGGFEWREAALVSGSENDVMATVEPHEERGCSAVGCAFGAWLRIGWDGPVESKDLPSAPLPDRTVLVGEQGGRWQLHCVPDGRRSAPALPAPEKAFRPHHRRRRIPDDSELTGGPWAPFLDVPPPALSADQLGFDTYIAGDTDAERVRLRGYVWGPRGAESWRTARWLLRTVDRFDVGDDVWSTAATRAPWDGVIGAAQAFGYETTSSSTSWHAELDPSGRSGALVINHNTTTDLYLFEEGRAIVRVPGAYRSGLGGLAGVVKVSSTWWIGSLASSRIFRVLRVDGDRISDVKEFPIGNDRGASSLSVRLVRTASGDQVGIWAELLGQDRGFVYPYDPDSGTFGAPLVVSPQEFSLVPRACTDDDPGWIVQRRMDPYLDFGRGPDFTARRLDAKFRINAAGLCVEGLAADAEAVPPGLSVAHAAADAVPLVVSERRQGGRRLGFSCTGR